jgi:pimeloyl-ACP methyl ester carboxylesterase
MRTVWVELLGAQVRVGGNRLRGRFVEAGEGDPLILLHGQGGHVENFARNIMPLAERFHVFALDCVWHGYGPHPPFNPEIMPTFLEHVLDFMDWAGIDRAHLEGQSMGAWIAMTMAYRHPERVRSLVVVNAQGFLVSTAVPYEPLPGPSVRARSLRALEELSEESVKQRLAVLFAKPDRLPHEMVLIRQKLYSNPTVNASLRQMAIHYTGGEGSPAWRHILTEKELSSIAAPTLVVWGDQNFVPPPVGKRLAEVIPNARFVCLEDAGHWAQFEQPEQHNNVVLGFLTGEV